MVKILTYPDIDPQQWSELVQSSPTATWFQTNEAYRFYQSVGGMQAFTSGVTDEGGLVGVVVGYITHERNPIKQYFTRRWWKPSSVPGEGPVQRSPRLL